LNVVDNSRGQLRRIQVYIYIEHSYNKSQLRKQKEEESDVRNIKARFDSNICQAVDTSEHIFQETYFIPELI